MKPAAVRSSRTKLEKWISENGWAGYDPFTVQGSPLFLRLAGLPRILPFRILRYPFFATLKVAPGFWLKVLGCHREINAKGMGLFAKAYLNLYEKEGQREYLDKARFCLQWLEENSSAGYSGLCWGYPFDWRSHVFFPKGTPSSVVSFTVGDAFWSAYRILGEKKYLQACESICTFFMKDLNRDCDCFSYTPLDKMHVHNANLFVAEYLVRVGRELNRPDFIENGMRAVRYSLDGQRPDGAWPYFGRPDTYPDIVDHYHTGFVLRMLASLHELTGSEGVGKALEKGFPYYLNHLFDRALPRYSDENTYPVDIHACAEAILCLIALKGRDRRIPEVLDATVRWTLEHMQSESGYFYYMKNRFYTIRMPYLRWGQAWMLLALSEIS